MAEDVQHNESELLQEVARGSRLAYTSLYLYYLPRLYTYIYPFTRNNTADAEEIIQEIFISIWEKRELLLYVRSFQAYIFRMARYKLADAHKLRGRQRGLAIHLSREDSAGSTVEEDQLWTVYTQLAEQAILQLPPGRQQIFRLHAEEGLRFGQIAERLGISVSVVKKQWYAAIDFVRVFMKKHTSALVLFLVFFLY